MEIARYGLPLVTSTAPAAGAPAPITLAGTLVQQNAEALIGVILSQLVNPGTPVFYSAVPLTMDMRTELFSPRVSDRRGYQGRLDAGAKDSWKQADEIARAILSKPAKTYITDRMDAEIRRD